MPITPYIIGMAGPSCSGKSTLANCLAEIYGNSGCVILPIDSYYRDLSHLPVAERGQTNFDIPDAIEHELFIPQLEKLSHGQAIQRPIYDFTNHTRRQESEQVEPFPYIIVEGLFTFYWPAARECMALKIFLEAGAPICLNRRQNRDVVERGRTIQAVQEQFHETVVPMYEAYIKPTKIYADLILNGQTSPGELVSTVLEHLAPHHRK